MEDAGIDTDWDCITLVRLGNGRDGGANFWPSSVGIGFANAGVKDLLGLEFNTIVSADRGLG